MHIHVSRRAFSLVELVVVVATVGVACAIAAPRYGASMARYRAEMTAWRVAADLELARSAARTTGSDVTVLFDVPGNGYSMPGGPELGSGPEGVSLADGPCQAQLLAANFGGLSRVVFDGFGLPDSGGTITVASGGFTRTVVLDAGSGLASVQ